MIQALLAALAAALALAAGQTWRLHQLQSDMAAYELADATEAAQRAKQALAEQTETDSKARTAANVYLRRAQTARVASAGAAADLRGVLDALTAATRAAENPAAACRTDAERVRVLSGLLAEGAGLVAEGEDRVGRLDARLSGAQAHIGAVIVP